MFNFNVNLAGYGKVGDTTCKDTTCRPKFKAPSLQTIGTKSEWPPENMGFKGKKVWSFQTKTNRNLNINIDLSKIFSGIPGP